MNQFPKFVNISIINNRRMHFNRSQNTTIITPLLHLSLSHINVLSLMVQIGDAIYVESELMFFASIAVPHSVAILLRVPLVLQHLDIVIRHDRATISVPRNLTVNSHTFLKVRFQHFSNIKPELLTSVVSFFVGIPQNYISSSYHIIPFLLRENLHQTVDMFFPLREFSIHQSVRLAVAGPMYFVVEVQYRPRLDVFSIVAELFGVNVLLEQRSVVLLCLFCSVVALCDFSFLRNILLTNHLPVYGVEGSPHFQLSNIAKIFETRQVSKEAFRLHFHEGLRSYTTILFKKSLLCFVRILLTITIEIVVVTELLRKL